MSELLDYYRVNAAEAYGCYGFLGTGGGAIRLDKSSREPVEPEPMKTPARAVRLSQPLDREPNPTPVVQKAKDPLTLEDIDLSDLERWLSGDDYEPVQEAEQEPEPEPAFTPVVELDKVTFHDVILGAHGGQDVKQKEPEDSFVSFLRRHYAEQRQGILDAINSATNV